MEGFWAAMQQQATLQRCTPLERWDADALYDPEGAPGRADTRFGAFAADVDLHDAAFFRLSRTEALSLDPQTRLLLQVYAMHPQHVYLSVWSGTKHTVLMD